jgi:glycosidase
MDEFWPTVIKGLRTRHPETVLMAEAYWDLEWELQQQGFDFCYDKRLYDRIMDEDVAGIRAHLSADLDYQSRLIRFLENHDEPRVAGRLPANAERAAAVAIATLPGATLWHEGQFEGRRVHPPVFLGRRPEETLDQGLADWYRRLLDACASHRVRAGTWRQHEAAGWPDNDSSRNLLAWSWTADGGERHLIVINFSGEPAQGRVPLSWPDLPGRDWRLESLLGDAPFDRAGDELAGPGLFVDLPPWQFHLVSIGERQ